MPCRAKFSKAAGPHRQRREDDAVARLDVFCKWFSAGVSLTQGGHQVAQKFSMTTLPFRSARCTGFPVISSGKSPLSFQQSRPRLAIARHRKEQQNPSATHHGPSRNSRRISSNAILTNRP